MKDNDELTAASLRLYAARKAKAEADSEMIKAEREFQAAWQKVKLAIDNPNTTN